MKRELNSFKKLFNGSPTSLTFRFQTTAGVDKENLVFRNSTFGFNVIMSVPYTVLQQQLSDVLANNVRLKNALESAHSDITHLQELLSKQSPKTVASLTRDETMSTGGDGHGLTSLLLSSSRDSSGQMRKIEGNLCLHSGFLFSAPRSHPLSWVFKTCLIYHHVHTAFSETSVYSSSFL